MNSGNKMYSETISTGDIALAPGNIYVLDLSDVTNVSGSVDVYWNEDDGPSFAGTYYSNNGSTSYSALTPAGEPGVCTNSGSTGYCSESFTINSGTVPGGGGSPSSTPEPASLGLLGSGLAGLFFLRNRRKT